MSDDVTELPDGLDESEREAWEIWLSNGNDADADSFRDSYMGCSWNNPADYVEEITRDCYDIPEAVIYYIDWDAMANDWRMSGDIWWEFTEMGVTHLFMG